MARLARDYQKRIEIYTEQEVSDGYGGFTTDKVFVRKVWARVETNASSNKVGNFGYKFQQFGLNDFKNPVIFSVRAKINLSLNEKHFIRYKNRDFIIKGIEEVNLEGIEIVIFADSE